MRKEAHSTTRRISLDEMVIDPSVNIRDRLDERLITEYMGNFAYLPKVVIFETSKGLILADGFHRVAAARRLGHTEILAEVRKGTYAEALEYAALVNLRHGSRLQAPDRANAISRLRTLHPRWTHDQLGKVLGLSRPVVAIALAAERVRQTIPDAGLPTEHLVLISRMPPNQWIRVVEAVKRNHWSKRETDVVCQILRNPDIRADYKEDLLAGRREPIVMHGEKPGVLTDTLARKLAEARENNARLPLWKLLETVAILRARWKPNEVPQGMRRVELDHLLRELPGDVQYMQEILEEVGNLIAIGPRGVRMR